MGWVGLGRDAAAAAKHRVTRFAVSSVAVLSVSVIVMRVHRDEAGGWERGVEGKINERKESREEVDGAHMTQQQQQQLRHQVCTFQSGARRAASIIPSCVQG